jgi:hypothetical protein
VLQPTSVQYFDRGGIFEIERPEWPGWISGPDKTGNSSNWGSNAKHGLHGRSLASTTTDLKKRQNRLAAALPTLRRRQAIAGGGGDPRSMVPVRLAGAEVTGAFWASAAGDYCGCARRGNSLVGLRFPERITQIANAAEVLTFVVDRHPEPRIVLQSEFVAVVANERAARIDMAPWRNHLDENPNSSGCQRPIQPDDLRVAACFTVSTLGRRLGGENTASMSLGFY